MLRLILDFSAGRTFLEVELEINTGIGHSKINAHH